MMPSLPLSKKPREANDRQARVVLLSAQSSLVKVMAVSLTEVAPDFSEDTATDLLYILHHLSYSLEVLRSTILSLRVCQEATVRILDACTSRPWGVR